MNMLEVLEQVEKDLTSDIRFAQKRRREVRASIIALKSETLSPVAETHKAGHVHGDWDAGGYCNKLVMRDGSADVCGYQKISSGNNEVLDLPDEFMSPHGYWGKED